ncbi:MAG: formate--tetrahydrofolate ligase [Parvularculaceae bacterium]
MNDRSLRDVVVGLGEGNGVVRQTGSDITVASEVMAILCSPRTLTISKGAAGRYHNRRHGDKTPVTARDLKAEGAMTALLKDAINPNLVQTLENNPAIMHGGPFANIAHGCNSGNCNARGAVSRRLWVVTEVGFRRLDLGAEKFLSDIKCRKAACAPKPLLLSQRSAH